MFGVQVCASSSTGIDVFENVALHAGHLFVEMPLIVDVLLGQPQQMFGVLRDWSASTSQTALLAWRNRGTAASACGYPNETDVRRCASFRGS